MNNSKFIQKNSHWKRFFGNVLETYWKHIGNTGNKLETFVETLETFVETLETFVETLETFVETLETFVETLETLWKR